MGNFEKLSKGSFFKPAPALVPQTPVNNQPTFFKPAVQTAKNDVAEIKTNSALIDKSKNSTLISNQPVVEDNVHQISGNATDNGKGQISSVKRKKSSSTFAKKTPKTVAYTVIKPTPFLTKMPSGKDIELPVKLPPVTSNASETIAVLQRTTASKLGSTFTQVKLNVEQSQGIKRNEALKKMPEVPESEGSIYGGNIKGLRKKEVSQKRTASIKNLPGLFKADYVKDEPIIIPTVKHISETTINDLGNNDENIEAKANEALDNVQLDTSSVPESTGPPPEIDLSGEADPELMDQEYIDQAGEVNDQKEESAKEINNNFGENDIISKPASQKIRTDKKPRSLKKNIIGTQNPKYILGGVTEKMDKALVPYLDDKIGGEKAKYDAEEQAYNQSSTAEFDKANQKIAKESLASRQKQFEESNNTVAEVNGARVQWRSELDGVEVQYRKDADKASGDHKREVSGKVNEGNEQIRKEYEKGDKEIADEKAAAEKKAREEKEKKRSSGGGFFGWVRSAVSSLVNAVKSAFNWIVNKLRDAVKWVIDKVKKLVNFVIDTVRCVITGLIKAFGALLKGFVSVAFAFFPEIRDRINAKIDGAVNKAVEVVNTVFDTFKKVVNAIIDFVADVIDSLLSIIQKVVSGLLTLVGMIITGQIAEIFRRLGYIKDAMAAVSLNTIKQGGIEELMGVDLDQPLNPGELAAAQQMGLIQPGESPALPTAPWTTENVDVNAVAQNETLSPELMTQLLGMKAGGIDEMELAENASPDRTMEVIMKEAMGGGEKQPADAQKQDDGLTPMRRADIRWEMMKKGLTDWWDKNWPYVVLGIIGALVVFIAAEIFTGGAITAALPIIIPILEYVFAGIAIAQFGKYFVDFLEKSWDGDVKGGTKAISRGLGAALIELAMYLGFGLLKLAGKAAKAVAKGVIKIGKQVFKGIIKGLKFIIQKGKVLLEGVAGKALGKFAKSLKGLADDIFKHTRFRRLLFRIKGNRWELLAEINPLFVIMAGPMPDEELLSIVKKEKSEVPAGLKKGERFVDNEGRELMKISELDKFERTPDYREIFELVSGKGISDDVIHHLIEKNSRYSKYFEKEIINAPVNLRAIPKGEINSVLHLSDIRKAWDRFYFQLDEMIQSGLSSNQIQQRMMDFMKKTEEFIAKSLEAIQKAQLEKGRLLTKEEIGTITGQFLHLVK